jgi:hypothetical protein
VTPKRALEDPTHGGALVAQHHLRDARRDHRVPYRLAPLPSMIEMFAICPRIGGIGHL